MEGLQVGDRVITCSNPKILNSSFMGMQGEITEVLDDQYRVRIDDKPSTNNNNMGWTMGKEAVDLLEPSKQEVAALFGLNLQPPGPDSTQIELLEHIDNALRNGSQMTRANLAFEFLLDSLGHSRLDLPSYVQDMQESEK